MTAIMALTKRTRYEVLKRDNHTCRYCGGSAPDVKLTVDHVTPVALGGSDAPDNLVAACQDCNAGKSSTSPSAELVADVSQDALRWASAIQAAAVEVEQNALRHVGTHMEFAKSWREWDAAMAYLPADWWLAIDRWMDAGLSERVVLEALNIARAAQHVRSPDVFAYLCGVANNKIADLHNRARQLLNAEEV